MSREMHIRDDHTEVLAKVIKKRLKEDQLKIEEKLEQEKEDPKPIRVSVIVPNPYVKKVIFVKGLIQVL